MKKILSFFFFIIILTFSENNNNIFALSGKDSTIEQKEKTIFSKESRLLVMPVCKFSFEKIKAEIVIRRTITAYSIQQHRTASGVRCKKGIAAANWLPLGTKIKIPKIFGNKIFVIADRMNIRYPSRLDIWMSDKAKALNFGTRTAEIIVLDSNL